MEWQHVFDLAVALIGFLGGAIVKAMWDGLKDLQYADKELASKVSAIEILVAGNYIRRDEFANLSAAIFAKLDKIEGKIDSKVGRDELHGHRVQQ